MRLTRRKGVIGVAALFVIFLLGLVLSPWDEYMGGYWQLWRYMKTCPLDQLRIESFTEGNLEHYFTEADYATITVNLSTGEISDDLR